MAEPGWTPVKKAAAATLLLAASFFPVLLYDRLIAQHLLSAKHTPSLREVIDLYHIAYYKSKSTWQTTWLGIHTVQNPNDVWITQELIAELKPDFIVEAGTWRGGSAAIWAMVQDQVNPRGRVISIDIQDYKDDARLPPILRSKVDFIIGSSVAPEVVAEVARRVKGGKVMVLLDSDHHRPHVLAELRAYAPLVSIGSYLIVQDTNVNGHPVSPEFGPGPMEALDEFLASDDRFRSDRSRERLLFTMHPKGYLKREK